MQPIINSLLDLDYYKLTMGQVVFKRYAEVPVVYGFTNRTNNVRLAEIVSEHLLREELDHACSLTFTPTELHYLASNRCGDRPMFCSRYLDFLANLRLPGYELHRDDGTYYLQFPGRWSEVIYWETLALSIMNELYYRTMVPAGDLVAVQVEGQTRLEQKIKTLLTRPDITLSDFGTRRRFSRSWQDHVVQTMATCLPKQFRGTSNVALAMKYGLEPIGTSAHEMFMVMSGIMHERDDTVRSSHNRVLQDWWEEYGWELSIALTDTFGSSFFFRDMTAQQAAAWKGLRHDSGDPLVFGENAIGFYQSHGVDPTTKLLVFSDGLDLETILTIANCFAGRIRVTFGWGTNLTNDLGRGALSLVVKAIEANGHRTVKLSDNLAKATGAQEDIVRFKRIFGHTVTLAKECRY
ncbi:MAG TPA: nicotinate phosphoribosyltransferase [Candidatus Andersenbacteria bacterium]|nr:nicotinate phosphoribosyltransferase [Candidatus Andersenbacteria bacterium]